MKNVRESDSWGRGLQPGDQLTLCEQEVGHQWPLEWWLSELEPVWNLSQQQLHHNQQFMDLKTETNTHIHRHTYSWSSKDSSRCHRAAVMSLKLTVCLKPTAVCCGAFLRALVKVLRASEYSSWMALIRPVNTHTYTFMVVSGSSDQPLNHTELRRTCVVQVAGPLVVVC